MFENDILKHEIQRSIVRQLMFQEIARFSELRPANVDTNLFSYHLKLLLKQDLVAKAKQGYTLSSQGLRYVDRMSTDKMQMRTQPKIITMLLVQDGYGKVLLQKRTKQPYINTWTLPYGKLHIDDVSLLDAARRESREKLDFDPHKLRHVGDCYIRVTTNGEVETATLAHIIRFDTDAIPSADHLQWVEPLDLPNLRLAPAVEQIVTRSFFGDDFFFEEFTAEMLE